MYLYYSWIYQLKRAQPPGCCEAQINTVLYLKTHLQTASAYSSRESLMAQR